MERRERAVYVVFAVLIGILVALSYTLGLWSSVEARIEDSFFKTAAPHSALIIVAIDDESLARLGQWPWPRATYARLIEALEQHPPKALALDVLLSEPSRVSKADDLILQRALSSASFPIILGAEAQNISLQKKVPFSYATTRPLPLFEIPRTSLGLVNVISDKDGTVRSYPEGVSVGTTTIRALALETLTRADLLPHDTMPQITRIVYSASPGSIRTIPFYRLLESDAPSLKDAVVFLGATAPSLRDSEKTPRSPQTAGVEIHATIANMLLKGESLTPLSKSVTIILILLIAALSCLFFLITRRVAVAILYNLLLILLLIMSAMILFEHGLVLNVVHASLASLLTTISLAVFKTLRSEHEKQLIKQTFSKYVSPHVLDTLLAHPKDIKLGGEEREITVLFSDIRGFTSISEAMEPTELVTLLNRYFKAVTKEIIDTDGVLDKYIGDAIMAFWGAPIEEPRQAEKAVKAALGMHRQLAALNETLKSEGKPEIAIGVGVYSGKAVVGNVGSDFRYDYTAIGDTVNAASRLEGLTKDYKAKVIIGESTKVLLTETEGLRITALGSATVKGKKESITLYSVEEI